MIKTVGRFSMDTDTGVVTGPARYMTERGSARLRAIEAGADPVFTMGLRKSPCVYTAVLVSLQTDFAGWLGQQQIASMASVSRSQQRRPRRPRTVRL